MNKIFSAFVFLLSICSLTLAQGEKVPDWAHPGSETHVQVTPPSDFRTFSFFAALLTYNIFVLGYLYYGETSFFSGYFIYNALRSILLTKISLYNHLFFSYYFIY